MQANFASWDLVPVSIPARSRLHWIEPIGIGTPFDSPRHFCEASGISATGEIRKSRSPAESRGLSSEPPGCKWRVLRGAALMLRRDAHPGVSLL
jgi:hypothetical protein